MTRRAGSLRRALGALVATATASVWMPGSSLALRNEYPLQNLAVISDSAGESRVLLDFATGADLSNQMIMSAEVTLHVPGIDPSTDIEVVLYEVDRPWVGAAPTWTHPWSTPGGDLGEWAGVAALIPAGRSTSELSFDVTEFVREAALGRSAWNGFMLVATGPNRAGFRDGEVLAPSGNMTGTLRVSYRRLTGHGIDDGGQRMMARKRQSRGSERVDLERPR